MRRARSLAVIRLSLIHISMCIRDRQCRDARLKSLGYRKALINNYVMIYRVDEDAKAVYILRFFYARRDYEKLI